MTNVLLEKITNYTYMIIFLLLTNGKILCFSIFCILFSIVGCSLLDRHIVGDGAFHYTQFNFSFNCTIQTIYLYCIIIVIGGIVVVVSVAVVVVAREGQFI